MCLSLCICVWEVVVMGSGGCEGGRRKLREGSSAAVQHGRVCHCVWAWQWKAMQVGLAPVVCRLPAHSPAGALSCTVSRGLPALVWSVPGANPQPPPPLPQAVAQGRVWSGRRAVQLGLVDALGGLRRALALAKEAAGIPQEEGVRLVEYSRAKVGRCAASCCATRCHAAECCLLRHAAPAVGCPVGQPRLDWPALRLPGWKDNKHASVTQPLAIWLPPPLSPPQASPLALLSGGGASAAAASSPLAALGWVALRALGGGPAAGASVEASLGAPLLLGSLLQQAGALAGQQQQGLAAGGGGMVQAVMPEGVEVQGVGSAALLAAAQAQASGMAGAGVSLEWALGEEGEGLFDR